MKLSSKASCFILTIIVALFVPMVLVLGHSQEEALRRTAYKAVDSQAESTAKQVANFIENSHREVAALAATIPHAALRRHDPAVLGAFLKKLNAWTNFGNGMFLLDGKGTLILDYPEHPEQRGVSFAFREYFIRTVQQHRGVISIPYVSARSGRPVITFTAPIYDRRGSLLAVLACSDDLLDPAVFGGIQSQHLGRSGYLYLFDHSRTMILHPDPNRVMKQDIPPGSNLLLDKALEGFEGTGPTINSRGVPFLVSYRQVPGTDWVLGAQIPQAEAFESLSAFRYQVLELSVVALVVLLPLGWLGMARLASPLNRISKVARAISEELEGEPPSSDLLATLATIDSRDEIGVLAQAFRVLVERQRRGLGLLRQANKSLAETITMRMLEEEQRRQLQAQLEQAQKMESLGSLAGGVAHDMNNVLAAILSLASANLLIQTPGTLVHRSFKTIEEAATRGADMVKRLLSFARKSPVEERDIDLNLMLREQVALLAQTTLARIRMELDLAPDLKHVRGDGHSLANAIMNICLNAVDAMVDQGVLTLRTRNLDDGQVEVAVIDTGVGMAPEVLEKAFDPFFTTKEVGKGTGLGLSMAYSTVKAHRGQLLAQSSPGHGTSVILRLPSTGQALQSPVDPLQPQRETAGTVLDILLIDDDDLVREASAMMLSMLHHSVVTARSGEEALDRLEAGLAPDLAILDMNMPGLGGTRTMARMRALRPTLPVVLATGRVDQDALDLIAGHALVALLPKPFGREDLQRVIEQAQGKVLVAPSAPAHPGQGGRPTA